MNKKNKIFLIIISFVIAVICVLQIELCLFSKNKVKYDITLEKGNEIQDIYINDFLQDLSLISEFSNKKNHIVAKKRITVSFSCSKIDNISISFKNKKDVVLKKNGAKQKIKDNVYYSRTSTFNNIIDSINLSFVIFLIISFILYYICLNYIYKFFLKIKNNNIKIYDIILFSLTIFAIFLGCFYILLVSLKFIFTFLIIAILILILYKTKTFIFKKIENMYLVFAVILGVTILFMIPPLNVPDEAEHFTKSYSLTSSRYKNDNGCMNYPKEAYEFVQGYKFNVLNTEMKFNGKDSFSQLLMKIDYNKKGKECYKYGNVKHSLAFSYLPAAIVMYPLINFGGSPLILSLCGRFINLLITIILGYYSLKKIPKFKKSLFLILLMPIYLQQSAAFNVDYFTNSISIYTISTILYYVYKADNIYIKDIVKLGILALLITICKFGFFPVMFLVALIPKNKFKIKKVNPIVIKIIIITITVCISFILNRGLGGASVSDVNTNNYTVSYSVKHVSQTVMIFINTVLNRGDLDIFRGFFNGFGVSTKWLASSFQTLLIIIYGILFLESNEKDYKINLKQRLFYLFLALFMFAIPYVAMYLCWTKIGEVSINGLQPRYFMISGLLLLFALSNNILNIKIKNKNKFYSIAILVIYAMIIVSLILGFY